MSHSWRSVIKTPIIVLVLLAGCMTAEKAEIAQENTVQEAISLEALRLRAELEKRHPGAHFTKIIASPIRGLFEVRTDKGGNAYVFADSPRYFLFGSLFDTEEKRSITELEIRRQQDATVPIRFDQLPLEDAIKTVHGTGERQLVVFSDPFCIYCRQLAWILAGTDNVTIYTFLIHDEGLHVSIWCAKEHDKALEDFMVRGEISRLHIGTPCEHPLSRNSDLARSLGIVGTPTLVWADGSRTEGFTDRAIIEFRLTETSKRP